MIYSPNEKIDFEISEPLIYDTSTNLSLKNCLLCGESNENLVYLPQCHHSFCQPCGRSFIISKLNSNQTLISCPLCTLFMDYSQIHKFSNEDTFKRYQRLSSLNPVIRNCPNLGCEGFGLQKPDFFYINCNFCSQNFCLYCGKVQHFNYPCRLIDDVILEKWLTEAEARFCPQCKYYYIRDESGCSFSQCFICYNKWCWDCGLKLISKEHNCEVNKLVVNQETVEIPVFSRKKYENFFLGFFSVLIFITYPIWTILNSVWKYEKGGKNWTGMFFKVFKSKVIIYLSAFIFSLVFWPFGMIILGYKCGISFFCTVICNKISHSRAGLYLKIVFSPLIIIVGLVGCILFVVIITLLSPISLCIKIEAKELIDDEAFMRN